LSDGQRYCVPIERRVEARSKGATAVRLGLGSAALRALSRCRKEMGAGIAASPHCAERRICRYS
jgi:hypothetical protein